MNLTNRVLVLGDNDLACLTIVRSLGRSGLEVHLVSWYPSAITRRSRYVHKVYNCGHPEREPSDFVNNVLRLVESTKFDLVIPVLDAALVPLMEVADTLRAHTVFAAPDRRGFEMTHNKGETIRLAQQLGVDIPTTKLITRQDRLGGMEWPSRFPLVLKPALGGPVRKVRTCEEAEQKLASMIEQGPVLVQEFCPGYGIGLNVLGNCGEIVAAFQHMRVHEPPEGGVSSYRKSMPLSEDLLEIARRMCRAMNWSGPAMFEFKTDPSSHRSVLMEINGRFWGSLALPVAAGVDFPKLLYDMLVKHKQEHAFSYRVPHFARNTRRDFFWFFNNLETPSDNLELLKVKWPALLKEVGNILSGRESLDVESLRDPVPGLLSWMEVGRELVKRVQGKLERARSKRLARRMVAQAHGHKPSLVNMLRQARSVLFLCHGNINRSAFAEQKTRTSLCQGETLRIASAGFIPQEGRRTPQYSLRITKELGVDLSNHRSKVITKDLLAEYDIIFVMDSDQLQQLQAMDSSALKKTVLLGALDIDKQDWEIEDPYGKSSESYYRAYSKIGRCIEAWLNIRSGGSPYESR